MIIVMTAVTTTVRQSVTVAVYCSEWTIRHLDVRILRAAQ
jgi:hypothetical protein